MELSDKKRDLLTVFLVVFPHVDVNIPLPRIIGCTSKYNLWKEKDLDTWPRGRKEPDILLSPATAMLFISNDFPLHIMLWSSLLTYSDSGAAAASNTTYILLPSISIQQLVNICSTSLSIRTSFQLRHFGLAWFSPLYLSNGLYLTSSWHKACGSIDVVTSRSLKVVPYEPKAHKKDTSTVLLSDMGFAEGDYCRKVVVIK